MGDLEKKEKLPKTCDSKSVGMIIRQVEVT